MEIVPTIEVGNHVVMGIRLVQNSINCRLNLILLLGKQCFGRNRATQSLGRKKEVPVMYRSGSKLVMSVICAVI
jgi:hypothetical protein